MALPAGRYGVTKNQLLKIKKLPMNTIKLIEELTEKFDLLGSAAFKNSTSVVTDSSDLVESGAVYTALQGKVGWADANEYVERNYLINEIGTQTVKGVTFTTNQDGSITINGTATEWFFININYKANTLMIPKGEFVYKGGVSGLRIKIYADSASVATGETNVKIPFTIPSNATSSYCRYEISAGAVFNNVTIYPFMYKKDVPPNTEIPNKCDNSVIAPVENGSTASQAYAVNDVFIRNGALCKVTSAISQGDTLNNQFTVTNAGAILTALLNA